MPLFPPPPDEIARETRLQFTFLRVAIRKTHFFFGWVGQRLRRRT